MWLYYFLNYFKEDRKVKISDYVLGNKLINKLLGLYVRKKLSTYYIDTELKKIYEEKGITDLIIAGYPSSESITLATTASSIDSNVWLVINSWKDFHFKSL